MIDVIFNQALQSGQVELSITPVNDARLRGQARTFTYNISPLASGAKEYSIQASVENGGTISPSGSSAVRTGDWLTYAITANTDHVLSDVLVDGQSVGRVHSYTFNSVQANHTIQAIFTRLDRRPQAPRALRLGR